MGTHREADDSQHKAEIVLFSYKNDTKGCCARWNQAARRWWLPSPSPLPPQSRSPRSRSAPQRPRSNARKFRSTPPAHPTSAASRILSITSTPPTNWTSRRRVSPCSSSPTRVWIAGCATLGDGAFVASFRETYRRFVSSRLTLSPLVPFRCISQRGSHRGLPQPCPEEQVRCSLRASRRDG